MVIVIRMDCLSITISYYLVRWIYEINPKWASLFYEHVVSSIIIEMEGCDVGYLKNIWSNS
jgi:hypothetical protein